MSPGLLVLPLLLLLTSAAFGQQTNVTKYDFFAGYAFLDSPHVGLAEHGVQMQVGIRPRTWYSIGFDYSYSRGDLTITPDLLPTALQQQLGAQLAGLMAAKVIPSTYQLLVPASSTSESFALGPQLAYRHFKHLTFFFRPSMGAIHETATPRPGDAIAKGIVAQLTPSGKKTDWTGFYGVGYGFDIRFTNHFGWRTQGDLVWDHLFNDVLRDGRWTTRISVGPCFNFGRNIAER